MVNITPFPAVVRFGNTAVHDPERGTDSDDRSGTEPLQAGARVRYPRLEHLPDGRVALSASVLELGRCRQDEHAGSGPRDDGRMSPAAKQIQEGHRVREGRASLFLMQPLTSGRKEIGRAS